MSHGTPRTRAATTGAGPHLRALIGTAAIAVLMAGCQKEADKEALPPPEVSVANPSKKTLVDYEKFTGRTEPIEQVEIRARVSGYLTKIKFDPGTEVEKGKPLFEIDVSTYQAVLDRAEAEVMKTESRVERLSGDYKRARVLMQSGSIKKEEVEKIAGDLGEAKGMVASTKAQVVSAKLDVEFSKIAAPIAGQIGDRLVTEGNLVTGGQGTTTLLTTIVAVDPMDAVFDVDENTLQQLHKGVREGRIKVKTNGEIPVEMGLSVDGNTFPFKGSINFVNNRVDPKTGTIKVKARFANPKPAVGRRPLVAGVLARIRVPIGESRQVLAVPESALGSDQGNRYLFVVDGKNTAVRLGVTPGSLEEGMREILNVKGPDDSAPRPLRTDERVIVKGIQRVRPGLEVSVPTSK